METSSPDSYAANILAVEQAVARENEPERFARASEIASRMIANLETVVYGKKEEIKAGTPIIIFGWDKQPDGSVLAKTLYIGRSVTPAM